MRHACREPHGCCIHWNKYPVQDDENNHHDSLQPHLIEENGHHPDKFAHSILNWEKANKGLCLFTLLSYYQILYTLNSRPINSYELIIKLLILHEKSGLETWWPNKTVDIASNHSKFRLKTQLLTNRKYLFHRVRL